MSKTLKDILFLIAIIAFVGGLICVNNFLNSNKTNSENENKKTAESASIIEVTSKTFEKEVLNSDKKVLVDFYADWCGPCHMLHPIIEEIAKENPDIKVVQVNVDNAEDLAIKYRAMSIPLLVVIEDGEEVDRVVGVVDKEYILDMLK